mmetsp:Transcript_28150/g.60220  ORF Transcript_28150/g.60220 Transcript_28150/m.60220 type:complete len:318 (+) Transcript_28150:1280-2233(+)
MQFFAEIVVEGGVFAENVKSNGIGGIGSCGAETFGKLKSGVVAEFEEVGYHERGGCVANHLLTNFLQNVQQVLLPASRTFRLLLIQPISHFLPLLPGPLVTSPQIPNNPTLMLRRHRLERFRRRRERQTRGQYFGNVMSSKPRPDVSVAPASNVVVGRAGDFRIVHDEFHAGGGFVRGGRRRVVGGRGDGDEQYATKEEEFLPAQFPRRFGDGIEWSGGRRFGFESGGGGSFLGLLFGSRFEDCRIGRGHFLLPWNIVHVHGTRPAGNVVDFPAASAGFLVAPVDFHVVDFLCVGRVRAILAIRRDDGVLGARTRGG